MSEKTARGRRKTKETPRTPQDTINDVIVWLMSHEEDIADGVNDFGELKLVFIELTGQKAKSRPRIIHG